MMNLRFLLFSSVAVGGCVFAAAYDASAAAATANPMALSGDWPGLSPKLSAAPPYTCTTNYYVDTNLGNDKNPGTASAPWKTIQNAESYPNTPVAGECVNVRPGLYFINKTFVLSHGGTSNSPTGYVVYRSTVPQKAHLIAESGIMSGGNGDIIMLWSPYIIIDGFEIDGNKSLTSGDGIDGCADGGAPYNIAHHFIAINNFIHDMGGSGLSTCTAEFISWQHNVVMNTAGTNHYQMSGLNLWQPKALAAGSYTKTSWDYVPFQIVMAYNKAMYNSEGPSIPTPHTDGNGIIVDTTLGSATCPTCGVPYAGQILVLGNSSNHNGGGGIHVFLSQNVTVAKNTVYENYQDTLNPATSRGELSNLGSQNVNWIDNIGYAVPGSGVLSYASAAAVFPIGSFPVSGIWTHNIFYGAGVSSTGGSNIDPKINMIGVNPKLTNPSGNQFIPLRGSPAVQTGQPENYLPPKPDIGAW
jgi:hypothetical protein